MAKVKDAGDGGNKFMQFVFYAVVILGLIAFAAGPVRWGLNRAQKASLKSGLKNLRDAYTAHYSSKARYPSDDLHELDLRNGGNIQDWPIDPTSGTGQVVTSCTGTGGWFHDLQKHDVFVNKQGEDYSGQPYNTY